MRFRTAPFLGLIALVSIGVASLAPPASAHVDVSFNVFFDSLSPYGTWFDYPGYGRVWRPAHVGHGWRPYTDGRWVWSDDYGWVWDGHEDWGWATYHYGRWLYDGRYGWVWVPGYEWGPAWVDWRYGPEYIGWVPLPPARIAVISLLPTYWSFVPRRSFFDPHLHNVVFVPSNAVFRECRDEVRLDQAHGHWFNRGVDRASVERFAHVSAPVVHVRDVDRPGPTRFVRGGRGGDELHIYRPNIREASAEHAPPGDARFRDRPPQRHVPAPPPAVGAQSPRDRAIHPNAPLPNARDRAERTPVPGVRHVPNAEPREAPAAPPRETQTRGGNSRRGSPPTWPQPQRVERVPRVERDAAVPRPEPMHVQPQPQPARGFHGGRERAPMQAPPAAASPAAPTQPHVAMPQARVERAPAHGGNGNGRTHGRPAATPPGVPPGTPPNAPAAPQR